jgi:hypothetical protein
MTFFGGKLTWMLGVANVRFYLDCVAKLGRCRLQSLVMSFSKGPNRLKILPAWYFPASKCDIASRSGEDDLKRAHGGPEQNVDPRQRAAESECDYKNRAIDASSTDGLCRGGVNRALICGPQLIYVRHLLIPSQRTARSMDAVCRSNLRILNNNMRNEKESIRGSSITMA